MSQFIKVTNGNAKLGVDVGSFKGLIEIAERVVANAKALAPVDLGQLKNSIMYKAVGNKEVSGGFNDSGGETSSNEIRGPKKYEAHVGFNLLYGIYQEFGTRYQAPQPFLRPALDIVINNTSALDVLKKIQQEEMLGALKKGQKRETFNV